VSHWLEFIQVCADWLEIARFALIGLENARSALMGWKCPDLVLSLAGNIKACKLTIQGISRYSPLSLNEKIQIFHCCIEIE
jgi:hypothetical protein